MATSMRKTKPATPGLFAERALSRHVGCGDWVVGRVAPTTLPIIPLMVEVSSIFSAAAVPCFAALALTCKQPRQHRRPDGLLIVLRQRTGKWNLDRCRRGLGNQRNQTDFSRIYQRGNGEPDFQLRDGASGDSNLYPQGLSIRSTILGGDCDRGRTIKKNRTGNQQKQ